MRRVLLLSSCLLILLLLAGEARADVSDIASIRCYSDPNPSPSDPPDNAPPLPPGKLTGAVFDCIHDKLQSMSTGMVTTVFRKVTKAVSSVLMLAILFFAIKYILYGTRQAKPEFFTMMLKFTVVAMMVFGIGRGHGILDLSDIVFNTGTGLQNLVLTGDAAFGISSGSSSTIFDRMDQVLFKIYGIKDPNTIKMDKDMAGIGMMGGLLLAGPLGAKAFVQGGLGVGMLVGAFMIALYISVVSLIAITFLFTLSPVILPLALFPATENIFQKWRGQLFSYSLQPMIMTVFISMMFIILQGIVGSLGNFIQASNDMSNNPGVASIKKMASTATTVLGADKKNVDVGQGGQMATDTTDPVTGGADMSGVGTQRSVDKLTKGIGTKDFSISVSPLSRDQLSGLGSQMVVLLIVCGAMLRFMKELPEWAAELAGGGRTVPNLAKLSGARQLENQFEKKK